MPLARQVLLQIRMRVSSALLPLALVAALPACAASTNEDDSPGTSDALTEAQRDLGSLDLAVEGDAALSVSVRTVIPHFWSDHSTPVYVKIARSGVADKESWGCELSKREGPRDVASHVIDCNQFEITRTGSRYVLAVSEKLYAATGGQFRWNADDRVIKLDYGQPKELSEVAKTGLHPFAIAERVDAALAPLVGLSYRGQAGEAPSPIRAVATWADHGTFSIQPRFRYGELAPYRMSADCHGAGRPSLYVDAHHPDKGIRSADELTRLYREYLDPAQHPIDDCR